MSAQEIIAELSKLNPKDLERVDAQLHELLTAARNNGKADENDEFGYPKGWFEKTCGSLADVDDFAEPPDHPPKPVEPLNL